MNRIRDILANSPHLVAQAQSHRWCLVHQRVVHPRPIVQIPPQPYGILQHNLQVRTIACAANQASLLAPYRAIEPFGMRRVDLLSNAQVLNTLLDLFLFAKQRLGRYLQQIASAVSNLLHNAHQQIRWRLETGMLESASAVSATPVFDLPKNLEDCLRVRQMVVYQDQRRSLVLRIKGQRSGQLRGCLKRAWADDRFEKEPAFHPQGRMKPRFALFLLRRLRSFLGTLTNSSLRLLLTVVPYSSSICTAPRGSSRFSSCR